MKTTSKSKVFSVVLCQAFAKLEHSRISIYFFYLFCKLTYLWPDFAHNENYFKKGPRGKNVKKRERENERETVNRKKGEKKRGREGERESKRKK